LIIFKKPEEINLQENESIDIEEYEIKTPKTIKLNSLVAIQVNRRLIGAKNKTIDNKCRNLTYLVSSRSMILNTGIVKICDAVGQINFYATILHSPFSNIILYYLNEKNEFFVQTKNIKLDKFYNNVVCN
jgi:hypothetical protein